jgi:hypothetical protein
MSFAATSYNDVGFSWTGALTANTVGPYFPSPGKYAFGADTSSGAVTLNVETPAGNYVAVSSMATGGALNVVDLPDGNYKVTFVATGAVSGFVSRVRGTGV